VTPVRLAYSDRRTPIEGTPLSQPQPEPTQDQVLRERAAGQVSDVMLNLEWTLASAKKGHNVVAKDGVDRNAELALAELAK